MYDDDTTPAQMTLGGTDRLEHALFYAGRGWPVLPIHSPKGDGSCSCGNEDCSSIGKHPRIRNWPERATTDEATIREWWGRKWPDAGIGIACGKQAGIVVLDVDPRNGGKKSLDKLTAKHAPLPRTETVHTGGDGTHFYFEYPKRGVRKQELAAGIDLVSDRGYVIAPPSRHAEGRRYEWVPSVGDENRRELQPLPDWLLQLAVQSKGQKAKTDNTRNEAGDRPVIPEGQRNQTLTSYAGSLRRGGLDREGLVAALLGINEEKCRPPLPEAEVRQIARSVAGYPAARVDDQADGADGPALVPVPLSEITPSHVEWLWDRRIPFGKLSALVGDPGVGKSTLALDLAARLSTGRPMPDGGPTHDPADALVLSAEDGARDTLKPRLEAAGADVKRIHVVKSEKGDWEPISFPAHVEPLRQVIRETGARLVIIDPLAAFLGSSIDMHRDKDVRQALAPLASVAEETGAAILLVAHLNKSEEKAAIHRVSGSIGIVAAVRAGHLLAPHPQDPDQRVLSTIKSNLCRSPDSLLLRLVGGREEGVPRFEYGGRSGYTADEVLRPGQGGLTELERACEFLRSILDEGAVPTKDVEAAARERDISKGTLDRAREELGIESRPGGFRKPWVLELPAEETCSKNEVSESQGGEKMRETAGEFAQDPHGEGTNAESSILNYSGEEGRPPTTGSSTERQDAGDSESPDTAGNIYWTGASLHQDFSEVA